MLARWLILAGGALAIGCGPSTGVVAGKVTVAGQPLSSGSVTLIAADGQRFHTALTGEGQFTFEGVPIGRARIAVKSHPRVPPILLGKARYTTAGLEASRHIPIPARYGSAEDSGLYVDVQSGRQTCQLELKDE